MWARSQVDSAVVDFFVPAAEKLLASEQPSRVLAAALANMSGFRKVRAQGSADTCVH
jgi:ATP-dependent RNA helicase DDX21